MRSFVAPVLQASSNFWCLVVIDSLSDSSVLSLSQFLFQFFFGEILNANCWILERSKRGGVMMIIHWIILKIKFWFWWPILIKLHALPSDLSLAALLFLKTKNQIVFCVVFWPIGIWCPDLTWINWFSFCGWAFRKNLGQIDFKNRSLRHSLLLSTISILLLNPCLHFLGFLSFYNLKNIWTLIFYHLKYDKFDNINPKGKTRWIQKRVIVFL